MNDYPGDLASPEDVARWMARVAENEFGLPGLLPVMTSCVELTAAWTGPGDVKTVRGYLNAVDHDSFGYFQQRPSQGWGTREQLINADYALRAFCREAVRIRRSIREDDANALGEWCADVQRPREDLRHLYTTKGYPMARELLKPSARGDGPVADWPQRKVGADKDGWIVDLKTKEYIRTDANITYNSDSSGWLYVPRKESNQKPPKTSWSWPTDLKNVGWLGDGSYVDLHPSRYDTVWRSDCEEWARHLVDNYDVSCNTYVHHPAGRWGPRDETSFDVWGPAGRGSPIDPSIGSRIFSLLLHDKGKPDIDWIIWQARIYGAWNRWAGEPFGEDVFSWHYDHIHVTYH